MSYKNEIFNHPECYAMRLNILNKGLRERNRTVSGKSWKCTDVFRSNVKYFL